MKAKLNKAMGAGLISAFFASLCCIAPLIAIIGGISGFSSLFSWMEPFRIYLIVISLLAIAYSWLIYFRSSKNKIDCECENNIEKKNIFNTKGFLLSITLVSIILISVPYITKLLTPVSNTQIVYVNSKNIQDVEYTVKGMTCQACELEINSSASKVKGVISVESNYSTGKIHLKYDKSKVKSDRIISNIENETGYKVDRENIK